MTIRSREAVWPLALMIPLASCAGGSSEAIGIDEVLHGTQYYYACGNEILDLPDGRTFYPLHPDEQDDVDEGSYDTSQASSQSLSIRVAPPGPGDDTSTLTIYEDDMARWVSDSGIEAWLTVEPQEYYFVC